MASSKYRKISAASTNADTIKGSAGEVGGWYIVNEADFFRYVKLYNKATNPTVGTDSPALTLGIPANASANVSLKSPLTFAAGIAIAMVTGIADGNADPVALNELAVNIFYV